MKLCSATALVALSPALSSQDAIRVPSEVPTIQGAIELAQHGDTVLVAPGSYTGVLDFLGKAITVASEAGPASTIVDGNDGSFLPVVSFHNDEGVSSVLRGFTVTNGDNRFTDVAGGGISCVVAGLNRGTPVIQDCIITGNRTLITPGAGVAGNPRLEDCLIRSNVPGNGADGGGVWGAPTLLRCVVSGNSARDGGGIYLGFTGSVALIEDCVIEENVAIEGTHGGGLYVGIPFVAVRRTSITRNKSIGDGGMFAVNGAGVHVAGVTPPPRLERCTIVGNTVEQGNAFGEDCGGVFGNALLVDCIVRGNDDIEVDATSSARFSNVQGGFPGQGNIDLDPLFANEAGGDYHLLSGSPCIDAGDPAGALDPDFTRADLGAFYYPQAGAFLRNGSGANRAGFASLGAPIVGGTWRARIDSHGHPGAVLASLLVTERALAEPLQLHAGELLIDLSSPLLAHRSVAASGGFDELELSVPANLALLGFHAWAQALLLGGRAELLNALELALGNAPEGR